MKNILFLCVLACAAPDLSRNSLTGKAIANDLNFYYPSSEIIRPKNDPPSNTLKSKDDLHSIAINFMMNQFQITDPSKLQVTSSWQDSANVYHCHCKPMVDGLPVVNAGANVNVNSFGQIVSMGHSWTTPRSQRVQSQNIQPLQALQAFSAFKNLTFDATNVTMKTSTSGMEINGVPFAAGPVKVSQKFYRTSSELVKVYDLAVPMVGNYFNAFVSMDGNVVGLTNWASSALTIKAVPLQKKRFFKRS